MNDHVHILVFPSKYKTEYTVNQLKGAATHSLQMKQTPWAKNSWKIFINDQNALYSAARYIESNPPHAGLPVQKWDFVEKSF
jgi:REP element-mobilizing transposase RayT